MPSDSGRCVSKTAHARKDLGKVSPQSLSRWQKLAMLLFATIVVYVTGDKGGEEQAPEPKPDDKVAVKQAPGTVVVTVRPEEDVEVFVDGKLRAESTPCTLDDLEPGEHLIEVRHEDFETFSTRVDVRSNGFVPIDAELEKK